jgi:hypothetical protein
MRILKRVIAGFFLGGTIGAIIGAVGGVFDRGSLFILVPSGPLAWAVFGAFCGCIAGAFVSIFWAWDAKLNLPSNHYQIQDNTQTKSE